MRLAFRSARARPPRRSFTWRPSRYAAQTPRPIATSRRDENPRVARPLPTAIFPLRRAVDTSSVRRTRRTLVRLAIGTAGTVAFLVLFLREVALGETWGEIRTLPAW